MNIEVIALGLISAIRPATAQAAVFALLRAPLPARLLFAYTVAGFVVSVSVGSIIVVAFNGVGGFGKPDFTAVFDVVAGMASIGFAAGVARGGLGRRRPRGGGGATAAIAGRLRNPSILTSAAAGVATHVPGLIYLVALNTIASDEPGLLWAGTQVAIYNALWFAIPVGAFVVAVRSPDLATRYLDRLTAWARLNQERIVVVLFGALGLYLTIKGIYALTH